MLAEIGPHARELGADRELEGIRDILAHGNGADRQLQTFAVANSIVEVAAQIADQTDPPGLRRQAAASSARCGRRDHDQGSGSETTHEGSRRAE